MPHRSVSSSLAATHSVPLRAVHILPLCGLCSRLHCHKSQLCASSSPFTRLLVYLLLLRGRSGSLHENWRGPLSRAHTIIFQSLFTPRKYLNVLLHSPSFLALVSPFYPSFSFCLVSPKLLYGQSWFPPRPFHTLSIRHPTLFQFALLVLSPIQPYQLLMLVEPLLWHVPYLILPFQHVSSFEVGTFPYLPFSTAVLLVIVEHLSMFGC